VRKTEIEGEREREREREKGGEEERKGGAAGIGMEEHHTDEPFKLLTPETTRLSAF